MYTLYSIVTRMLMCATVKWKVNDWEVGINSFVSLVYNRFSLTTSYPSHNGLFKLVVTCHNSIVDKIFDFDLSAGQHLHKT